VGWATFWATVLKDHPATLMIGQTENDFPKKWKMDSRENGFFFRNGITKITTGEK
jgi:hypothetical protein